MEQLLKDMFTLYGPLGMGWILAWYLLRQNMALQDRVLTAFLEDTKAKVEMRNALDALAAVVKGK